jgi:hypothetical protein
VTSVADHLSDEQLSTLLDAQLAAADETAALAHLATCSACTRRLADFRAVSTLLRQLPEVEPPRDFLVGPRVVAEPTNVIRLQRWYTWSRAAAGSLAAVFVFLVAGTLFVDATRPITVPQAALAPAPRGEVRTADSPATAPTANTAGAESQPAAAPKPAAPAAPPPAATPQQAPAAQQAAKPATAAQEAAKPAGAAQEASKPAAAAPAALQARAQPTPAANEQPLTAADASDQVKAATSVSALATATSVPVAQPSRDFAASPVTDAAAPWRAAASVAGILAALALLIAFVVRHRLRAVRTHPTTVQE